MSSGLEQLKAIGIQKIHEQTHISRQSIQSILDRDYNSISRVQFNGFLTILEREYKIDLSELKNEFSAQQGAIEKTQIPPASGSMNSPTRESGQKKGILLIAIAAIVLIVAAISFSSDDDAAPLQVEKTVIVEELIVEEVNASDENITLEEEVVFVPAEPVMPYQLVIEPKMKLWMGYIDLKTHKRYTKLTKYDIELDPKMEWLMVFAHGHFKVLIGDETMDFANKNKVRMIYEDGKIREIDIAEFKERNRGKNW